MMEMLVVPDRTGQAPDAVMREPLNERWLLERVALLAGLGGESRSLAAELELGGVAGAEGRARGRTCVDAGSSLMLSLLAPGARTLRVLSRHDRGGQDPGVHHWLRIHRDMNGRGKRWFTEAFAPTGSSRASAAWQRALHLARVLDKEEEFRRHHAGLGPRGRIFNVSWSPGGSCGSAWISWQLDRRNSLRDALEACGAGEAWAPALRMFRKLVGGDVSDRYGPWSVSWQLDADVPHLRVGSTAWARHPEGRVKRRLLVATVDELGGDSRYAEALYKLLEWYRLRGLTGRIGRAAEVELCGAEVRAMEFYLSGSDRIIG